MNEATKIFVLDTSVIIHDPEAVFNFGEHDIVVPLAVITELDGFKSGNDQKAYNAREFSRILDVLKERHSTLMQPVPLPDPGRGKICISGAGEAVKKLPVELHERSKDRQIISTALGWIDKSGNRPVVLVSKDTNVRLLGHACGLMTEDYKRGRVIDYDHLFDAPAPVSVDDSFIDRLMREHYLPAAECSEIKDILQPNLCVTLIGNINPGKSALAIIEKGDNGLTVRRLLRDENRLWGLVPRNREQIFAAALLLNNSIRLVSLLGKAGTGKTLLALAAALEQTFEVPARNYKKIVVMRPMVPVGKDLGLLPGDVSEKIAPWMKPIYDNLSYILGEGQPGNGNTDQKSNLHNRVNQLFLDGLIEVEVLSFVRGRSINDAFIIIDESQNLTPHEIKTIITRAAGRSKVVLTGDLDQIDTPYLDAHSSGLTHVVKKFAGKEIAGYVTLMKGERSELAEMASNIL